MPTATVQVRHTTTTTTSRASVLVINTGYLKSRLGILKLLILILALASFILVFLESDGHYYYQSDRYLMLVSFADWLTVAIMLISALLSLATAGILPKTSFDFIFHFVMGILIFVGGLLVSLNAFGNRNNRSGKVQASCILALVCGVLQVVHGIFSYRLCITN